MAASTLPYELLLQIFELLVQEKRVIWKDCAEFDSAHCSEPDYKTLYRCALANHVFQQVASRVLYSRVEVFFDSEGNILDGKSDSLVRFSNLSKFCTEPFF